MAPDKQRSLARGVVLFAGAVLIFFSLYSYRPGDVGHAAGPIPVFNYIGLLGAWAAFGLLLLLGWGAWALPALLAGESVLAVSRPAEGRLSFPWRLALEVLILLSLSPLFEIQSSLPAADLGWELEGVGLGGTWGLLAGGFLLKNLGLIGSRLVLVTALAVSAALLTEMKPLIWGGGFLRWAWSVPVGVVRSLRRPARAPAPGPLRSPGVAPAPARPPARPSGKPVKPRPGGAPDRQRELILRRREALEAEQARREKKELRQREKQLRREEKLKAKEDERARKLLREKERAAASAPRGGGGGKKVVPGAAPRLIHAQPAAGSAPAPPRSGPYRLPPLDLLADPPPKSSRREGPSADQLGHNLEASLLDFGIEARIVGREMGPAITRYELEPAPGVKVGRIKALENDIALTMKATSIRILAPIPGKGAIGIEVPNPVTTVVCLKEMVESAEFRKKSQVLPLAIGMDLSGKPVITDLTKIPHLLIAGATGSGKTVCMNSIIMSLLYARTPDELKMIMVDPKKVEMVAYKKLPHLLCPVVTESPKTAMVLNWLVGEMEGRYELFSRVPVRNIESYNSRPRSKDEEDLPETVPYIVLLIDELADLMITAPREIESAISRLAHLSRAVGIHMILATQRPSVDVITGVIKANFPGRISFKVAAKVDSRTVLDAGGADKLLGNGDLLFVPPGTSSMVRAQGTYCSDAEINAVVKYVKGQREPDFNREIFTRGAEGPGAGPGGEGGSDDPVVKAAIEVIRETGQASVSVLQRKLKIGYSRAARVMDVLEEMGVVGPHQGMKAREIMIETMADTAGENREED